MIKGKGNTLSPRNRTQTFHSLFFTLSCAYNHAHLFVVPSSIVCVLPLPILIFYDLQWIFQGNNCSDVIVGDFWGVEDFPPLCAASLALVRVGVPSLGVTMATEASPLDSDFLGTNEAEGDFSLHRGWKYFTRHHYICSRGSVLGNPEVSHEQVIFISPRTQQFVVCTRWLPHCHRGSRGNRGDSEDWNRWRRHREWSGVPRQGPPYGGPTLPFGKTLLVHGWMHHFKMVSLQNITSVNEVSLHIQTASLGV